MVVRERDFGLSSKIMRTLSAELGVAYFEKGRPLDQGATHSLGSIAEFLSSAMDGPRIAEDGPVSSVLLQASRDLIEIVTILQLPFKLDEAVTRVGKLKETVEGILSGQPIPPEDLRTLKDFLKRSEDYYQSLKDSSCH